jgi:hypothetical protein
MTSENKLQTICMVEQMHVPTKKNLLSPQIMLRDRPITMPLWVNSSSLNKIRSEVWHQSIIEMSRFISVPEKETRIYRKIYRKW